MSAITPSGPGGDDGRGFRPPPYPYERLTELAKKASAHAGGAVDMSVGTPSDRAPEAVMQAICRSTSEHGYPASAGSALLREAACGWFARRFSVSVDASEVGACVGTKEFVASTAGYLRLRDPRRDTVLGPQLAYPTYEMSARLAGCEFRGVPTTPEGTMDLSSVAQDLAARALMLWVNSPSNPSGELENLDEVAAWGRANAVPVFSDECYCEFTWEPERPSTILSAGTAGVVAVQSLSKRSNMAGLRVGFYAGDRELVEYLRLVRQHAGMMVPGPVQDAAAVALGDDRHVERQRRIYMERLERLSSILRSSGLDAELPRGGFYLWVPVPDWAKQARPTSGDGPAWELAEALAEAGGLLVSPGDLYGPTGSNFVRIAAVQPDDRIELVARRLEASTDSRLRPGAGIGASEGHGEGSVSLPPT